MRDVTTKETAKEIDSVAADWAARLDRGALSPEEDASLEAWLGGDPRRAGAFARARAVSLYSERARALGEAYDPDQFVVPARPKEKIERTRREMLLGGGALAASLIAVVGGGLAYSARGETYSTPRGQMKVVPLSDGSVVSLNTDSRIRVVYGHKDRVVHLEAGEALFDVVKDSLRPFRVLAGATEVLAIGTSFAVRHLADSPVEVIVRQGEVKVAPLSHHSPPQAVGANMRAVASLTTDHIEVVTIVAPVEIERRLAWREGRIAFDGQTLREAVAEFERYSDTRIVIDDATIANEPITGLFQVNDPVGFARAVASSFGLKAEVSEKQVRLHR